MSSPKSSPVRSRQVSEEPQVSNDQDHPRLDTAVVDLTEDSDQEMTCVSLQVRSATPEIKEEPIEDGDDEFHHEMASFSHKLPSTDGQTSRQHDDMARSEQHQETDLPQEMVMQLLELEKYTSGGLGLENFAVDTYNYNDGEDAKAAANFAMAKQEYDAKEKSKKITIEDEIEFHRAEEAEDLRLKLLAKEQAAQKAVVREERQQLMFVQEDEEIESRSDGISAMDLDDENEGDELLDDDTITEPLEEAAYQDLTLDATDTPQALYVEATTLTPQTQKGRKRRSSPKTTPDKNQVTKATTRRGKSTTAKKSASRKAKAEGPKMVDWGDNDIVANAKANRNKESQPGFAAKRKKDALSELVASIPEDHRKPYMADKKALDEACKKFTWKGQGSMGPDGNGQWRLKGMNTSLFHYQLLGAAWMRGRENGRRAPFGGIIADSMGMGKTVITIATLVDGRAPAENKIKTTLVVCPSSLRDQWMSEIKKHADSNALGSVCIYKGDANLSVSDPIHTLTSHDVVITSFNELCKNYPKYEPPMHLKSYEAQQRWWLEYFKENIGPLLRITWRRCIIDEAQVIKNVESRTSIACRALKSKYRWLLSGTPVQNTIEEYYPLLSFLSFQGVGSLPHFKKNYCSRSEKGYARLRTILDSVMIRRTGASELFGRPVLKLPDLDHQTVIVEFGKVERLLYLLVRARFIARINKLCTTGSVQTKHRTIFAMFIRLRQMCAHVMLVWPILKDILEAEDMEKLWRLTERETSPNQPSQFRETMTVLTKMFEKADQTAATSGSELQEDSDDILARGIEMPNNLTGAGNGSGHAFKFRKYLRQFQESGNWAEINARATCRKCHSFPDDPHVTIPCQHLYCLECIHKMQFEAESAGDARPMCAECCIEYDTVEKCKAIDEAGRPLNRNGNEDPNRTSRKALVENENEFSWLNTTGPPLMSTKTQAIDSLLQEWLEEDKKCKIIVFTQWVGMVKVLQSLCKYNGWSFCSYVGSMNSKSRNRSIEMFGNDPEKRILLATLQAGSLGLNLTMASRCIIVDPWWNESVEDQSYSRIFRIGQKSNVIVRRIIIKDTIDDEMMLTKQHKKTKEINKSVAGIGTKSTPSVKELLNLFGPLRVDEETGEEIIDDDNSELEEAFDLVIDHVDNSDSDTEIESEMPPMPYPGT